MTQEQALKILKTGANVFLTGEPGSGKTYTINQYIKYLQSHGIYPAITASTGIAATHIGGMTVHSWSGIGINKKLSKEDLESLASKAKLTKRIKNASVLIIDEISMLDAQTLNLVETVCRKIKNNSKPWGGMQVVFVGDFFQLPPVARAGEPKPLFAFCADSWDRASSTVCYLTQQYRQNDQIFLSVLSSIRHGKVNNETQQHLNSRKTTAQAKDAYTKLFSHNIDVDRINEEKLKQLSNAEFKFQMESKGPKTLVNQLKRGCLSPELLRLKVGAKIIFTKNNFEKGFVNGTLGQIIDFDEDKAPIVKTSDGKKIYVPLMDWSINDGLRTLARITQYPLRLAWAITVHKSQGMTLDGAIVDLSQAFEFGQGYVALSRVRALAGLFLLGWNTKALEVHPDILAKDASFRNSSHSSAKSLSLLEGEKLAKQANAFITSCGGKLDITKVAQRKNENIGSRGERISTYETTLNLWKEGLTLQRIAQTRGLSLGTILSHLEELFMRGEIQTEELLKLFSGELRDSLPEIHLAFTELADGKLTPVFQKFNGKYSYNQLRLARLLWQN